jgi:hypothetical protein
MHWTMHASTQKTRRCCRCDARHIVMIEFGSGGYPAGLSTVILVSACRSLSTHCFEFDAMDDARIYPENGTLLQVRRQLFVSML